MTTQTPISEEELREQVEGEFVKQRHLVEQGHYSRVIADEKLKEIIMQLIKQYGNQCRVDELRRAKRNSYINSNRMHRVERRISELTQTNEEES